MEEVVRAFNGGKLSRSTDEHDEQAKAL
jgi:hypothetical protein